VLENAARRDRQATDAQLTLIGKADMKNTTKKRKLHRQPSNKTQWAYWMQAIEPRSEKLNEAFPDFHPQWVQMSQQVDISPEAFVFIRKALGMNLEQCAAYLRVSARTIRRWESGATAVPFTAFETMRLVLESPRAMLANQEWAGWFMNDKGRLVSPDVACSFSPGDLNYFSFNRSEAQIQANETRRLQIELDEATAENTRLRQLFLSQGLVDELVAMQNQVKRLVEMVATAKVIPFPAAADQLKERTA